MPPGSDSLRDGGVEFPARRLIQGRELSLARRREERVHHLALLPGAGRHAGTVSMDGGTCVAADPPARIPNEERGRAGLARPDDRLEAARERVGALSGEPFPCLDEATVGDEAVNLTCEPGDVGDAGRPVLHVVTGSITGKTNLNGPVAERLKRE
jgi:hypothetical protein